MSEKLKNTAVTTLTPGSADTETAQPDSQALANLDQPQSLGFCTGTTGDSQLTLKPAQLGVSHGVGRLSENGIGKGAWALDDEEEAIAKKGEKLIVVITGVEKYWKEYKDKLDGELPRRWDTEAEALADGMITRWPPRGSSGPKPTASPAKTIRMFVRQPEGGSTSSQFILSLGGHLYAPVIMYADKNLCTSITPTLDQIQILDAQQRKVPMQQGRHDNNFMTLHSITKKNKSGEYDVVHLRLSNLIEDGKAAAVPQAFWDDLSALAGSADSAPVTGADGAPDGTGDIDGALPPGTGETDI